MKDDLAQVTYPRRRILRWTMHYASIPAFAALANIKVQGKENLPATGPCILVANHFSFLDPVAFVRIARWPLEFLGGAEFPHAPDIVKFIPKLWGYYPVFRGTGSRFALRAAEVILKNNGILGIFPEGGSWAEVLRPPRPGTAYLATKTKAKILPIGLWGLNDVFPVKPGHRPTANINIGKPFGPLQVSGKGKEKREHLDALGHEIMKNISTLLPEEFRGYYSSDQMIREKARGTEIYPWEHSVEGEVEGEVH